MINFNHVSKTFKRNQVLDNIDLKIELGERIALVGSNGAGKTTLIRCLLGEYTYDGEVTVNGLVPRRERGKVLQKIGFVPQLPPPLKMPVGQLVGFAASLCNSERKRMEDVAAASGSGSRQDIAFALRQAVRRHEAETPDLPSPWGATPISW